MPWFLMHRLASSVVSSGRVRSMVAYWMGGASSHVIRSGGVRSMTAFWMGGV